MAPPYLSQTHVNRPLTDISVAFMQEQANFVASGAAPMISSDMKSNQYAFYPPGDWFRDSMKKRAPAAESAGSGYNITYKDFSCEVWAEHHDVPDQLRANTDEGIDLEEQATMILSQKGMIRREKIFNDTFFQTGVWAAPGTDVAPTIKWDAANSTPIKDLRAGITAVQKASGRRANELTISQQVWDVLADHPATIDRTKYGTRTDVADFDTSALAALLNISRVRVMGGVENTAAEGLADVMDFIGGKHALLSYTTPTPGRMIASAMYTFGWTGLLSDPAGLTISDFRMEQLKALRVEGEMAIDMVVVAPQMGFFLPDVIS